MSGICGIRQSRMGVDQFLYVPCSLRERESSRLDRVLVEELSFLYEAQDEALSDFDATPSRSQVTQWIADHRVMVNGTLVTKSGFALRQGDSIQISIPHVEKLLLEPDASVRFGIAYEDEDLIVIDKPAGLIVHPGAGAVDSTLVHGLLHHLGDDIRRVGDKFRPGIVHRLDKDTSGLMVVAKNQAALRGLASQFIGERTIHRTYIALCYKAPSAKDSKGVIDAPIGRHPVDRHRMAVNVPRSRSARTHWEVSEMFTHAALLKLQLETGRTHQIRVHLSSVNAGIIGDATYCGGKKKLPQKLSLSVEGFGRQALHAADLMFIHPRTGAQVRFVSSPPEQMSGLIQDFR